MVDPLLEESCADVAVIVTWVVKGTMSAVKRPVPVVIVPPGLAVQNTVELKLPVPATVAVHWVVCWDAIEVGEQTALTRVIVGVVGVLLPLLQAASNARHHTPASVPRIRTPAPLLDLGDIYTLWHHCRHIGPAMEAACVSTLLKDETGSFNENRAMSVALLRRHGLFHRLEVGTKQQL